MELTFMDLCDYLNLFDFNYVIHTHDKYDCFGIHAIIDEKHYYFIYDINVTENWMNDFYELYLKILIRCNNV